MGLEGPPSPSPSAQLPIALKWPCSWEYHAGNRAKGAELTLVRGSDRHSELEQLLGRMTMTLGKIPLGDDAAAVESDQLPALGDESPPFTVSVRKEGDRTQVTVKGELDLATAPVLANQLLNVTGNCGGDVVIDMSLVSFIDSTGFSVLVAHHLALQAKDRNLTLLNPTSTARRLMQITGLIDMFTIEPNQDPGTDAATKWA
jgi:anti-anti-sigma factor